MSDEEETCYTGENFEKWKKSVKDINYLHEEVFPKIISKGHSQEWSKVVPSFPLGPFISGKFEIKELDDGYEAIDFFKSEAEFIDMNKATRTEKSALEIQKFAPRFMKIFKTRIVAWEMHSTVRKEFTELRTKEYGLEVQSMKIDHQTADTTAKLNLTKEINKRFKEYQTRKATVEDTINIFRLSSEGVAQAEGLVFNEKFNPKDYINYHQFEKTHRVDDLHYRKYFKNQDESWKQMLKYLDGSNQEANCPQQQNYQTPSYQSKEEKIDNEKKKFTHKTKMFKEKIDLVKSLIEEEDSTELQRYYEDLKYQKRGLDDLTGNPELEVTPDQLDCIQSVEGLLSALSKKIKELNKKEEKETELRRNEIAASTRSLEPVKMKPLNGYEDFIAWKESQECLNTHTDPHKKAAALYATLKNPKDRRLCENINDYNKMMAIVDRKYNNSDKLIPNLIRQLEKLPKANTRETMMENMELINNFYERFQKLSEESKFDGTIIDKLTKKFTAEAEKNFEDFKILERKLENIISNNVSINDQGDYQILGSGQAKDSEDQKRKLFLKFIEEELLKYQKLSDDSSKEKDKCNTCKKIIKYCKCKINKQGRVFNVESKPKEKQKGCPCCGAKELHLNNKTNKPTASISKCPKFRKMNLEEKKDMVNKVKACFVCLVPGHTKEECRVKNNCYNCEKSRHHPFLCRDPPKNQQSTSPETNKENVEVNIAQMRHESTIMVRTEAKVACYPFGNSDHKMINILFDSGANCNIIKRNLAEEMGYKGKDEKFSLTKVGETTEVQSNLYNIKLIDNENKFHKIEAFSLDNAPSTATKIDKRKMKDIAEKFRVPASQINNVNGEIGMIIGMGHINISPLDEKIGELGKLRLYKSKFGKPFAIGGFMAETIEMKRKNIQINHIDVNNKNYWIGDQLGLNTDPKCSSCLKAPPCKQCNLLNQPSSYREQTEGKLIKESMIFDQEKKQITVSYPFLKDVNKIFAPENSNRYIAEKLAVNLRKSLTKDKLLEVYTESFLDMEKRQAIRELTEGEMKEWEAAGNPINYCSHHLVQNDSKTTPYRSVCNSSLTHNNTTLNAMLPKGPTAISNLLHVLMRFRAKPFVVICDLSKAYNTIKTSERDCHLRRLLWYRNEDLEVENPKLRTFGMLSMAFGDTPAQYYLECAKEEVSNYTRYEMKDEKLADDILSKSYVDDVAISLETLKEAKIYKEKLPVAFGSYGFKIKEIFVGGDTVEQEAELKQQSLFGHYYDPNRDEIILKFKVNFSSKRRSQKTQPNLTSKSDLTNLEMTKRKVMSLLASQYDPLGLASVFLAKYKVFLAKLFKIPEYEWDVKLNYEHQKRSIDLVKQMIFASENSPTFKRACCPEGYKLRKLIVFVDASIISLQVIVYGLYASAKEKILTSLITGKNKICQNTVPRNELQSLVAGHRLVLNVLEALDEPVSEICFLSDSTCTLDLLKENFVSRDIFVINRVSEIRRAAHKMNCCIKYYHVESKLNIADKGTREDCKFEYLSSKEYQEGPEFIKDIESKASYKLGFFKGSIQYEINAIEAAEEKETETCVWTELMERSNELKRTLRVFCLIKSIFKRKSFKLQRGFTKDEMNEAFLFYIKLTQKKMKLEKMRTKQLVTFEMDEIIYTKMRFTDDMMKNVFGKDQLPVIPGRSKLAKLILLNAHKENVSTNINQVHHSDHQTLVNSRIGAYGCYITYAKQNIKGIARSCAVCRRQAKIPSNAKMSERKGGFGEVPPDGSAFNKIAIDYFGPFWCKPPRGRETRGTKFNKIFGMAVLCQQTRAVKFYPVEGYDTQSFLNTFKIHCSNHGVPTHVLSDPMTTFISGSKLVGSDASQTEQSEENQEKSEFEEILEREYNIDWEFIPPGSQWRDPAERSIKSLKVMMQTIFNSEHNKKVLTLNEYWCLFSECAEILNRRPIQGYMHEDTLKFICPNQLILGRTSKDQPTATSHEILKSKPRLELIENIKSEFWNQFMNVLAADSKLMKYPCWYSQSREPKVGDVVLVLYKTKVSDNYRIGKINSVNENKRDISCSVSPVQDSSLKHFKSTAIMDIPVQRTILLYGNDEEEKSEE